MEIVLTIIYAVLIGFYNVFKKLSLKRSSESVILVMFTTVSFLLSMIWIPFGIAIPIKFVAIFALKGFLLALSWYFTLKVLKDADLSLVSTTNILSIVLTFIFGIILFQESVGVLKIIGSVLVVAGITLINLINRGSKGSIKALQFFLLITCALITTTSHIIDKFTSDNLQPHQVQFWFLLFVCLFSWIFFLIECKKQKSFLINISDLKNYWIYLVGLFLFVGDFLLFLAYQVPNSQMTTISVISKFKVVVSVFAGILVFKEKNICKKILLTLLVILGVVLISISG